jgi:hypothetical protein
MPIMLVDAPIMRVDGLWHQLQLHVLALAAQFQQIRATARPSWACDKALGSGVRLPVS